MSDRIIELEGQLQELEELKTELLQLIEQEIIEESKKLYVAPQTKEGKQAESLYNDGWRLLNWTTKDPDQQICLIKDAKMIESWLLSAGDVKHRAYLHLGLVRNKFNYKVLSLLSEKS
jgi:hypothetical protein